MNLDRGHEPPDRPTDPALQSPVEEALRQSQEQFHNVVGAVSDYAVFLLDRDGRVATWNAGAERIKGYLPHEIIGRDFSTFYPPEAVAANWPARELEYARTNGRFEDEGWRVRKDGTRFWANVVITALYTKAGDVRGYLKITRDLTERRAAEEQLRAAHAELERRVEVRTAELERVNRALSAEVAERRRLEAKLRDSLHELQEADRGKDQFLASLAHELRNPLASVRSAAEFLRQAGAQPPPIEQALRVVDRQTLQLTRLVDDLLDMARMTRNAIALERRSLDLRQPIADAVDAARLAIDQRGQRFDVRIGDVPLPIEGDAARLTQAFGNLLHNASKFTPAGGTITLAVEQQPHAVVVTVSDSGIGIPPDQIGRVFDLFVQLEPFRENRPQGLGLGLTLARHLIELHGGRIEAYSRGRDQGTEMRVILPAEARAATGQMLPVGQGADARPRTVLVVDDNEDAAQVMSMLLSHSGHHARAAFDGETALREAETHQPEVVLLDIGMPGMNGYEIARRIRAMPFGERVVLVAITGWGQPADRDRARLSGFDYHLTKPADPVALERILTGGRPKQFVAISPTRG